MSEGGREGGRDGGTKEGENETNPLKNKNEWAAENKK